MSEDGKLVAIICYWDREHFEQGYTVWRCPACGSIGEADSLCPGHSVPDVDPFPDGLRRLPVEVPMPGPDPFEVEGGDQ